MCDLVNTINEKSVVGYKLVAKNKKTGKYFSSVMGFEYPKDKDIPRIRVQKTIGGFWADFILNKSKPLFRKDMVGRTACFRHLEDTKNWIESYDFSSLENISGFVFLLTKVRISKDLMEGKYDDYYPVYAGRRIEFLKEVAF